MSSIDGARSARTRRTEASRIFVPLVLRPIEMDDSLILPSALDAGIIKPTQQFACVEAFMNADVNPVLSHYPFEIDGTRQTLFPT